eukprot:1201658-Rhodomonas_salina.1
MSRDQSLSGLWSQPGVSGLGYRVLGLRSGVSALSLGCLGRHSTAQGALLAPLLTGPGPPWGIPISQFPAHNPLQHAAGAGDTPPAQPVVQCIQSIEGSTEEIPAAADHDQAVDSGRRAVQ